ncbi:alpha/beta hydrolase [Actinomadura algeriensis]|uniref:Pimeloyl-ACP methyl ester carboxylesterase n=1 Tax=Actinomadura algeriensis TaxID=1679523 RepID=A0ABR9JTS4_9ACTN|nr:alpha/beta hydrolase [Actinomadura algeriensis]MBE1533804.1 pimeloyl-ACP methyl ester carboxylesterase [Actinomadura algeriensis]
MLGCSLGASIGLHLVARHPEQVGVLVAHEPVGPRLLPADRRAAHERELADIQAVHRRDGLPAALAAIAAALGIDPTRPDSEPGLAPQPMTPQRVRDFAFFIEHDFTAIIRDTLDVAALEKTPVRIVPAFGRTTPRAVFDRACAVALAELSGTEPREFPGGHNGNTSHPRAYATALRASLAF